MRKEKVFRTNFQNAIVFDKFMNGAALRIHTSI